MTDQAVDAFCSLFDPTQYHIEDAVGFQPVVPEVVDPEEAEAEAHADPKDAKVKAKSPPGAGGGKKVCTVQAYAFTFNAAAAVQLRVVFGVTARRWYAQAAVTLPPAVSLQAPPCFDRGHDAQGNGCPGSRRTPARCGCSCPVQWQCVPRFRSQATHGGSTAAPGAPFLSHSFGMHFGFRVAPRVVGLSVQCAPFNMQPRTGTTLLLCGTCEVAVQWRLHFTCIFHG